jgi:heme A synthase
LIVYKRFTLALTGIALLVMLTACDSTPVSPEPTTWLQLVNDNFFWLVIVLLIAIPSGGMTFGRRGGKCKCPHSHADNELDD